MDTSVASYVAVEKTYHMSRRRRWVRSRSLVKSSEKEDKVQLLLPCSLLELKLIRMLEKVENEYDVFLLVTQAYSDKVKKNPSAPNRSRTYDLPISTSDALPLSYRRLVVARPLN